MLTCAFTWRSAALRALASPSRSVRIHLADIWLHMVELDGAHAAAAAAAAELLWQQLPVPDASAPALEQWLDPADEVIDPSSMFGWERKVG